ncbi:outer membrane beta-barrel protein [Oricola sp.]|uniref:outer membrane protein n=1 Tax=Oricola sp. TaxID=1979950 RepID=UPI0025F6C93C|nr:outer membrane beta-barrel protein [Oricola sp.]MCI5075035.1 outer membrane beta-barrel protein [Oricola sp.]
MRGTKFAVISALLLSSTAAYAADDLAPPPSAYDWTGFHLGAGAGLGGVAHNAGAEIYDYETGGLIQVGPVDIFSIGAMIDAGGDGYLGTIEGGYDVQVGNFVLGIQGDYTWSDIDATAGINGEVCYEDPNGPDSCDTATVDDDPSIDYSLSAKSSWSVLGRVGMVANEGALAYALGGYTRTHLEGALTLTSLPTGTVPLVSYDYDRDGWTVGGGIEALISGSTSMKMEYRRTRWDNSDTYPLGPEAGISTWDDATVHTIRGVLSYRFGGGSAEQQAAVDAIPTVDWTGFSVGASGGFSTVRHNAGIELHDYTLGGLIQVGPVDIFSVGGDIDFGGEGLVGRLEAGYDMQLGNRFVAGVLADYTFSNAESQVGLFGDYCLEGYKSGGNSGPGADDCDDGYVTGSGDLTYTLKTGDSWSVGGRAGVLLNPKTLFYGLGAYTRTSMDADLTLGTGAFGSEELLSYSYDRDGWTYGIGMETMLTDNLSTKLEYRNTKWTDEELYGDALQGFTRTEDSNVQSFTAGLTWRIN